MALGTSPLPATRSSCSRTVARRTSGVATTYGGSTSSADRPDAGHTPGDASHTDTRRNPGMATLGLRGTYRRGPPLPSVFRRIGINSEEDGGSYAPEFSGDRSTAVSDAVFQ